MSPSSSSWRTSRPRSILPSAYLALVFLAIPLLPRVEAADTGLLGCVSTSSVSAVATGTAAVQKTSQANCASYCSSSGLFTYAAYSAGALTGTNNCFCLTESNIVTASAFTAPSAATALCNALGASTLVDIKTTFVYSTCYAPSSLVSSLVNTVSGTLGVGVSSPDQCFQQCSGSAGAYIAPYISLLGLGSPTYGCVCAGPGVSITGVATACGLGNFIYLTHPAAAQASSLARRQAKAYTISVAGRMEVVREQEREIESRVKGNWHCPNDMRACSIQGALGSWECVDPQNDLESCGGCPYGDYIPDESNFNSTATGVDCTAMPGLLRGSATCVRGSCQAFACKRGFALVDGACSRL